MTSLFSFWASRSASPAGFSCAGKSERSNDRSASSKESIFSGLTLPAPGAWSLPTSLASQPKTQLLVATAALDHLFSARYFDICKLDAVMQIFNVSERSAAYQLLRPLHCIHYADMAPSLREQIPQLVNECLRPPVVICVATEGALAGLKFEPE